MKNLQQEISTWLRTTNRHLDELEAAVLAQRLSQRRMEAAREALEESEAEHYMDGSIEGKNKEQRDATLRRLTTKERAEYLEAKDAHAEASLQTERLRITLARDRQLRYALQMQVSLAEPIQPIPHQPLAAPISATRRFMEAPIVQKPLLQKPLLLVPAGEEQKAS